MKTNLKGVNKFKWDFAFLEKLGLGEMRPEDKKTFLDKSKRLLTYMVGNGLGCDLPAERMDEFEGIDNKDIYVIIQWLSENDPDYRISEEYSEFSANSSPLAELEFLAKYASIKWLKMNRPDYPEIVYGKINEIIKDIKKKKEEILADSLGEKF